MALILQFPSSRALAIRIERERDAEGWFILTHDREFGWLHGDFDAAIQTAAVVAGDHGVCVVSSGGVA
jgi:hypothetical protein